MLVEFEMNCKAFYKNFGIELSSIAKNWELTWIESYFHELRIEVIFSLRIEMNLQLLLRIWELNWHYLLGIGNWIDSKGKELCWIETLEKWEFLQVCHPATCLPWYMYMFTGMIFPR